MDIRKVSCGRKHDVWREPACSVGRRGRLVQGGGWVVVVDISGVRPGSSAQCQELSRVEE